MEWVTEAVLTTNAPVVEPALMTTDFGTVATGLLLVSVTLRPAEGAGPERVMVPLLDAPPPTDAGSSLTVPKIADLMIKLAETLVDPSFAVTLAVTLDGTAVVLQSKFAEVAPAAITTEPGPPQDALEDVNPMVRPPLGAAEPT